MIQRKTIPNLLYLQAKHINLNKKQLMMNTRVRPRVITTSIQDYSSYRDPHLSRYFSLPNKKRSLMRLNKNLPQSKSSKEIKNLKKDIKPYIIKKRERAWYKKQAKGQYIFRQSCNYYLEQQVEKLFLKPLSHSQFTQKSNQFRRKVFGQTFLKQKILKRRNIIKI